MFLLSPHVSLKHRGDQKPFCGISRNVLLASSILLLNKCHLFWWQQLQETFVVTPCEPRPLKDVLGKEIYHRENKQKKEKKRNTRVSCDCWNWCLEQYISFDENSNTCYGWTVYQICIVFCIFRNINWQYWSLIPKRVNKSHFWIIINVNYIRQ